MMTTQLKYSSLGSPSRPSFTLGSSPPYHNTTLPNLSMTMSASTLSPLHGHHDTTSHAPVTTGYTRWSTGHFAAQTMRLVEEGDLPLTWVQDMSGEQARSQLMLSLDRTWDTVKKLFKFAKQCRNFAHNSN